MVALKRFRTTGPSFADLVPYAGLVDNGILLLKDGSLMAGWYFAGPDAESATDLERNELSRQINAILSRLGSGWMIQVEAIRVPTIDYPSEDRCHFPDPVTRAIDAERRAHFRREQGHFESRHAVILTHRPLESKKTGLSKYIYSDEESRKKTYADTVLFIFRNAIRETEQYLASTLSIRRMETRETTERGGERVVRYDELMQFIRFCITGENHPVRLPDVPMYLDWLATAELQHGLTPKVENRFLGVVAIDGLPAESWPGILGHPRSNAPDLPLVDAFHFPGCGRGATKARTDAQKMAAEGAAILRSAVSNPEPVHRSGRHDHGGGNRGRHRASVIAARRIWLLHAGRHLIR